MKFKKFKGVIPALVTPLNADESINTSALSKLIEHLIEKKADGFYIGGATGEGHNLRPSERKILAESAVSAINGRVPSIIQVASTDFSCAVDLAKHAESIGADAISATAPIFFSYDEEDVYNYYKRLAGSVNIPLMVYYCPAANFKMSAEFAKRLFEIDNVTAIKWTSSDYYGMLKLHDITNGEMNIVNGFDEMLIMGLSAGADVGIGTTYNFMFKTIKSIYTSFKNGDIEGALAYQTMADRVIHVFHKYKAIPATKVILEKMGFDVGNATFPMKRYTDEEKQRLIHEMETAGLEFN